MQRDDATVLDIVLACQQIHVYMADLTFEQFANDALVQDAVLYRLTIIGEAVGRLSEGFRHEHNDVPWRKIAGMRHRVIHEYDNIHLSTVWRVVQDEVPKLRQRLEPLVPPP
ncbi:MAG: DUF86 domain-containing protein [Phycisphaeraceae bacterium]